MNTTFKIKLIVILLCLLSSCSFMYKAILGVDIKAGWELKATVKKQAHKYDIPDADLYIQDTVLYRQIVDSFYEAYLKELPIIENDSSDYFKIKKVRSDDLQPVQFRLFKKDKKELFKIVNCYVDPPIPMNWNVDGCFDTFPAKTNIEALNQHYFDLDLIFNSTRNLNGELISISELPEAEYYGVVLWNNVMKRPSKKLIKTVQNYVKETGENIHVIYIYNQYSFLWRYLDNEQKNIILDAYNQSEEQLPDKY